MPATDPATAPLHIDEVDGVRTVWTDAPGPLRAGLLIRVGVADETMLVRGISHLMEHLALFGVGRPGDHANGETTATTTLFHTVGDAELVTGFLDQLTRQLHEPPIARLDDERRVLQAEQARQRGTAISDTLVWRYGAMDYGLLAFEELGLRAIGADALAGWAARYVTRQNAVLWLSGPPPAGLRLHLPDGEARPAPDPTRSIVPSFPAWLPGPDDGAALHAVVERGWALPALAHILRSRLVDELRVRRAVSYSPGVEYRPMTGTHGWLIASTDVVAGRQSEAVRPFLNALRKLAEPGPDGEVTPADLEHWRGIRLRESSEPGAVLGVALSAAWELVHGRQPDSAEDQRQRADAVSVGDVAAAARQAFESTLAQVPRRLGPAGDPWSPAPSCLEEPLDGNEFPSSDRDGTEVLVLATAGITLRRGSVRATVPTASTAAVLSWPDGCRTLIGEDGTRITVEPNLVVGGEQLAQQVDSQWPDALRIEMPTRSPAEIPKPPPQQRIDPLAAPPPRPRRGWLIAAAIVAVLVAAGLAIWALPNQAGAVRLVAAFVLVAGTVALRRRR